MVNLRSFQGLAFDPQCLNVSFTQKKRRLLPDKCNLLSIYKNVQGSNFVCQIWASAPVFYVKISEVFTGKCFYTKAVQKFFTKHKGKHLRWRLYRLQGRSFHCVKSVPIRNYSGPHFPAFGLNTKRYSVSLLIHSECEKLRTRITPNTDTFYTVFMDKKTPLVTC